MSNSNSPNLTVTQRLTLIREEEQRKKKENNALAITAKLREERRQKLLSNRRTTNDAAAMIAHATHIENKLSAETISRNIGSAFSGIAISNSSRASSIDRLRELAHQFANSANGNTITTNNIRYNRNTTNGRNSRNSRSNSNNNLHLNNNINIRNVSNINDDDVKSQNMHLNNWDYLSYIYSCNINTNMKYINKIKKFIAANYFKGSDIFVHNLYSTFKNFKLNLYINYSIPRFIIVHEQKYQLLDLLCYIESQKKRDPTRYVLDLLNIRMGNAVDHGGPTKSFFLDIQNQIEHIGKYQIGKLRLNKLINASNNLIKPQVSVNSMSKHGNSTRHMLLTKRYQEEYDLRLTDMKMQIRRLEDDLELLKENYNKNYTTIILEEPKRHLINFNSCIPCDIFVEILRLSNYNNAPLQINTNILFGIQEFANCTFGSIENINSCCNELVYLLLFNCFNCVKIINDYKKDPLLQILSIDSNIENYIYEITSNANNNTVKSVAERISAINNPPLKEESFDLSFRSRERRELDKCYQYPVDIANVVRLAKSKPLLNKYLNLVCKNRLVDNENIIFIEKFVISEFYTETYAREALHLIINNICINKIEEDFASVSLVLEIISNFFHEFANREDTKAHYIDLYEKFYSALKIALNPNNVQKFVKLITGTIYIPDKISLFFAQLNADDTTIEYGIYRTCFNTLDINPLLLYDVQRIEVMSVYNLDADLDTVLESLNKLEDSKLSIAAIAKNIELHLLDAYDMVDMVFTQAGGYLKNKALKINKSIKKTKYSKIKKIKL